MLWKRLRQTLLVLLASFLLLLASISVLVETETGSRWALQLAARLLPLTLGEVRGNLRSGLDLSYLEFTQNGLRVRAEQASFRWRPGDLLYGALAVQSLHSQRLRIELPPSEAPAKKPDAPPFDAWPSYLGIGLRIHLDELDVRQIDFIQGGTHLQWQSLSGALSLGTFHLRYRNLALEHQGYGIALSGETDLNYPYHTQADIRWRVGALDANPKAGPAFPYLGSAQLSGGLNQLRLNANSTQPVVLRAQASTSLVNEQRQLQLQPHIQLSVEAGEQQLPEPWWVPNQPPPLTRLTLKAQGNWLAYSAQLHGQLQAPQYPALDIALEVAGDLQHIEIAQLLLQEQAPTPLAAAVAPTANNPSGARAADSASSAASAPTTEPAAPTPPSFPQRLALGGTLAWAPQLQWQLHAEGENLNLAQVVQALPSQLQLQVRSQGYLDYRSGDWQLGLEQLQANGSLRSLNLNMDGDLQLGSQHISSQGLRLVLGANQVALQGSLSDRAQLSWNVQAPMLNQLDPRLAGSLASQGQVLGNLQVPQVALTLNASDLAWGSDYQLDKLDIAIAPEQFAELVATTTGTAAPGTTTSSTTTPGTTDTPSTASGGPSLLERLRQTGQLNATDLAQLRYTLTLQGNNLHLGEQHIKSIALTGSGSANEHQLNSRLRSANYGSLDLGISGSYQQQRWQGHLQNTSIKLPKVPRWTLSDSQTISLSATAISLASQCFTTRSRATQAAASAATPATSTAPGDKPAPVTDATADTPEPVASDESQETANLCIEGNWNPKDGLKAQAQLQAIPLRQLHALFKPEVTLAGVIDGQLQLRAPTFAVDKIAAQLNLATRSAEVRYQFPGTEPVVYPWQTLTIKGELAKGQANADLVFHMQGYGDLEANAQLNLLTNRIQQARLQAIFSNLAPLETLAPQLNDVSGALRLNASATGPFNNPLISGELSLSDGAATLPQFGLNLQQIQLRLAADKSEQVSLLAQAHSEQGYLNLSGSINQLGSPQWQASANLSGSDFRVVNLPQLSANLSPDIQLRANSEAMRLTGSASIPWARAHIKALPPSTTKVSGDVVIIDEQQNQATGPRIPLHMDVRLILGKDVHFKGFGLDSQLSGNIQAFREGNRQLLTTGFVSVDKGTYRAYGQDLRIERGRLIFQGNYNNPGLDIRAYRTITGGDEEITAGLQLSGTLQRPNAKVYSTPSRSESEALLMLISGKPVKDASNADASLLLGILGGLAAGSSEGGITQNIADFFHVDEIGISADNGIDQSELWIGKQLTPKLMVRYMVGLFDNLTSLALQYQLNNRLRLEAESGEVQSVDLIYNFER